MVKLIMEVEHVDDITSKDAVNQIAEHPGIKKYLGEKREFRHPEDLLALPNEKDEDDNRENRERPNLALEHTPGATAIFDIREIEEARDNRNRRGAFKATYGELFDYRIRENQVHRGREDNKKSSHLFFSISLWHSMQVRTKG